VVKLRTAQKEDWESILAVVNDALPEAEAECQEWLENRINYDDAMLNRRHYVVQHDGESIIAYGAVEQGPEPHLYRMFIVLKSRYVKQGVAEMLYEKLRADLDTLGAEIVWVREETRDPILSFFYEKGFQERTRFMLENGREAIVIYLRRAQGEKSSS
jgi:L-amino acid N-acyltransferase YncA